MRTNNKQLPQIFGEYAFHIAYGKNRLTGMDYINERKKLINEFELVTSKIPDQIDNILNHDKRNII